MATDTTRMKRSFSRNHKQINIDQWTQVLPKPDAGGVDLDRSPEHHGLQRGGFLPFLSPALFLQGCVWNAWVLPARICQTDSKIHLHFDPGIHLQSPARYRGPALLQLMYHHYDQKTKQQLQRVTSHHTCLNKLILLDCLYKKINDIWKTAFGRWRTSGGLIHSTPNYQAWLYVFPSRLICYQEAQFKNMY